MLLGLNHITVTVTCLDESLKFYCDVLGFTLHAKWNSGAYLSCSDMWYCLSVGNPEPSKDYTHIAFTIDESNFELMEEKLQQNKAKLWKENSSEGLSMYILDPNKHKLEIHVGNLQSRLESLKTMSYDGLVVYNTN